MDVLIGLFNVVLALTIYLLPSIIAVKKNHQSKFTILTINFFLGFTIIGWVVALLWSFKKSTVIEEEQGFYEAVVTQIFDKVTKKKAVLLEDERECPYCEEVVKEEAIICRFCDKEIEDIIVAIEFNDVQTVKAYYAEHNNIDKKLSNGRTPLAVAISNLKMVKVILSLGASTHIKDKSGSDALGLARWIKKWNRDDKTTAEILSLITSASRKENKENSFADNYSGTEDKSIKYNEELSNGAKKCPYCAEKVDDDDIVCQVCHAEIEEIRVIIKASDINRLKAYLSMEVDIDKQYSKGETILYMACAMQDLEIVELLLSLDADGNINANDGTSPIDVSYFYGEHGMGSYSGVCLKIIELIETKQNSMTS